MHHSGTWNNTNVYGGKTARRRGHSWNMWWCELFVFHVISRLDISTLAERGYEWVDPGEVDWVGWLVTSPLLGQLACFFGTIFLHVIPVLWVMPCTASESTQFWGSHFVGFWILQWYRFLWILWGYENPDKPLGTDKWVHCYTFLTSSYFSLFSGFYTDRYIF